MVVDALSRKHVLVSTLSSKLMCFESLKVLYPKDPHFSSIFREYEKLVGTSGFQIGVQIPMPSLMVTCLKVDDCMYLLALGEICF